MIAYPVLNGLARLVVKFEEYSLAGITCSFLGQTLANTAINASRSLNSQEDVDGPPPPRPPPAGKTALSVYGIERLWELTVAKKIPATKYLATFITRFLNNVYGASQLIDLARWAGIQ
eukprot:gene22101-29159_t